MIQYLHCSRAVGKQLKALRKAGKKGELAALQGKQILEHLKKEGPQSKALLCKRTKHGEYRIRNCVKYDLGNGYRLVTVRQENHLYITFAGSHDRTDRWIERHRDGSLAPDLPGYSCEELEHNVEGAKHQPCPEPECAVNSRDPYEENLQSRIDDSLLKSIFQGLTHHTCNC